MYFVVDHDEVVPPSPSNPSLVLAQHNLALRTAVSHRVEAGHAAGHAGAHPEAGHAEQRAQHPGQRARLTLRAGRHVRLATGADGVRRVRAELRRLVVLDDHRTRGGSRGLGLAMGRGRRRMRVSHWSGRARPLAVLAEGLLVGRGQVVRIQAVAGHVVVSGSASEEGHDETDDRGSA